MKVYEKLRLHFGEDKIFIDKKDNLIGDNYFDNIEKAIDTSKYFIFFNSKKYKDSASCSKELLKALDLQNFELKIIEIKLDDVVSHNMLYKNLHLRSNDYKEISKKIIESIEKGIFSGFQEKNITKNKTFLLEKNKFIFKFFLNETIHNPVFGFVSKINEKNINVVYNFNKILDAKIDFNTNVPLEWKDFNFFAIIKKGWSIYKNWQYEIVIDSFNEVNDDFYILIHNPNYGGFQSLSNYQVIFKFNNSNKTCNLEPNIKII